MKKYGWVLVRGDPSAQGEVAESIKGHGEGQGIQRGNWDLSETFTRLVELVSFLFILLFAWTLACQEQSCRNNTNSESLVARRSAGNRKTKRILC